MDSFDIEVETSSGTAHLIVRPVEKKGALQYEIWNEENFLFSLTANENNEALGVVKNSHGKEIDTAIVVAVAEKIKWKLGN